MGAKKIRIKLIMPPYNFITYGEGILPIPPLAIAHLCDFMRKKGWMVEVDDLDIKIISDKHILDRMIFLDLKIDERQINEYLRTSQSNQYIDEAGEIFLNLISYKKYEIFGFSLIERRGIKYALLLAKKIREKKRKAGIVFGGALARALKDFSLEGVADLVVLGHGEEALLDFCQQYQNKKKTKKLAYGKKGSISSTYKTPSNNPWKSSGFCWASIKTLH